MQLQESLLPLFQGFEVCLQTRHVVPNVIKSLIPEANPRYISNINFFGPMLELFIFSDIYIPKVIMCVGGLLFMRSVFNHMWTYENRNTDIGTINWQLVVNYNARFFYSFTRSC
jgi:hypothetical protein